MKEDSVVKSAADFQFLVGQQHLDDEDGLIYVTTRVADQRGYILAHRRLRTCHGDKTREEKGSIHVADVVRMAQTLSMPEMVSNEVDGALPGL